MVDKETFLKAIRFERPDVIPMRVGINVGCRHYYPTAALEDLMAAHPALVSEGTRQYVLGSDVGDPRERKGESWTDPWGCVWENAIEGLLGAVREHPLADWSNFDGFKPPDPDRTNGISLVDWERTKERVGRQRAEGRLVTGGLHHGHTFLRLQDLRGYENLTYDMADGDPRLRRLIGMVEAFNLAVVERWMALEPDIMEYPEDLGMQEGPMLSPAHFRTYIKPVYERLMRPALDRGCIVNMHSDGDIRTLADDLVDSGVQMLNLQDLVNGIDWIAEHLKGRICIDLDVDRQNVTVQGTPEQIDDHIRESVEKLGSKEGGFMMVWGFYPGTPIENADAVMTAMERYADFYSA